MEQFFSVFLTMFCKIYAPTIFIRVINRAIEKLQNEYKINFIKVVKQVV